MAQAVERLRQGPADPAPSDLAVEALDGLELSACVPRDLALEMHRARLAEPVGVKSALTLPLAQVRRPMAPQISSPRVELAREHRASPAVG